VDENGAVQRVRDFKNLQPQVGIDLLSGQPLAHRFLRPGAVLGCVLSVDECTQPCAEKENFPVQFDLRQIIQRLSQIRSRQGALVPRIEGPQALRDPVFLNRLRVEVLAKVAGFDLRGRSAGLSGVCVSLALAAAVARLLGRKNIQCIWRAHRDEMADKVPAVQRF